MAQFDSIRFTPGRPLTKELGSERLNAIITEIKRNKPKGERGITVRQDGTGTYIGLAASLPRGGGTSTPTTNRPFQISSFADPEDESEDPNYVLTVYPGTINNLLPTNILDGEQLYQFSLPKNLLHYVVLDCVASENTMTSCSVSLETEAPPQQEPLAFALPVDYQHLLGIVYNSTVYQIAINNIVVGSKQAWILNRDDAPPGGLPYEVYLMWG
jgi:hypothetical protein